MRRATALGLCASGGVAVLWVAWMSSPEVSVPPPNDPAPAPGGAPATPPPAAPPPPDWTPPPATPLRPVPVPAVVSPPKTMHSRYALRRRSDAPDVAVPGPVAAWDAELAEARARGDDARESELYRVRSRIRREVLLVAQMTNLRILDGAVSDYRNAAIRAGALDLAEVLLDREVLLKTLGSDGVVPAGVVRDQACVLVPAFVQCQLPEPVGCVAADRLSFVAEVICENPVYFFAWDVEHTTSNFQFPAGDPRRWTRPETVPTGAPYDGAPASP